MVTTRPHYRVVLIQIWYALGLVESLKSLILDCEIHNGWGLWVFPTRDMIKILAPVPVSFVLQKRNTRGMGLYFRLVVHL